MSPKVSAGILVIILWFFWFSFFIEVNGATVSINPRTVNPYGVVINTKYGQVTPTNAQAFGSFTVYANGTIYFDNNGLTTLLANYNFQSYGNGTLKLKWAAPKTPIITLVSGANPSYPNFGGVELDYSTVSTGAFILNWSSTVSLQFVNIAWQLVLVLSLLPVITLFGLFTWKGTKRQKGKHYTEKETGAQIIIQVEKQPEYFKTVLKVAVVLGISIAIALVFSAIVK